MSLDHATPFVKPETLTHDAFLGGMLTICQPKLGFRAGLDSVLLGASVAVGTKNLLDLGAGVGTAALTALAHNTAKTALLAEIEPDMAALATKNISQNKFGDRAVAVVANVTAPGSERIANGLLADHFAAVIANPPYFDSAGGTKAPDSARAGARHMDMDLLDRWVRTAAACAKPRGEAIFIYRADGLPDLLAAFASRFGDIAILPIQARPGADAGRVMVRGTKGSKGPMILKAPCVLHGAEGHGFVPEIDAIFRGRALLHW